MIFFVATFLFFVCTIATLTSVREEPLISSSSLSLSSSRENGDIGNSNDDEEDQPEIDVDENRPLLSFRRNNSRSYNGATNRPPRSTASIVFRELNNQEGFVEIDPATGRHIPHDQIDRPNENILLQTLERSHQIVAASMNADPSNPTPVPTQAFEAELKQKAKLVKLGIQSLFIFSFYCFYFDK